MDITSKTKIPFSKQKILKLFFISIAFVAMSIWIWRYADVQDRFNPIALKIVSVMGTSTDSVNRKEAEIVVIDKSDYSAKFIKELKERSGSGPWKKFLLQDSLLIIDNNDTVYFPQTPKIGQQITLTGKKDNLAIAVTVKRLNYTTIDYKIEMVEFGKTNHFQNGQADIISSFFLGTESNESEKSGLSYFVTEFLDNRDNNCYTSIRLGYEKETGPYLLGKLIKNCNEKITDIAMDNFPTLIEK